MPREVLVTQMGQNKKMMEKQVFLLIQNKKSSYPKQFHKKYLKILSFSVCFYFQGKNRNTFLLKATVIKIMSTEVTVLTHCQAVFWAYLGGIKCSVSGLV